MSRALSSNSRLMAKMSQMYNANMASSAASSNDISDFLENSDDENARAKNALFSSASGNQRSYSNDENRYNGNNSSTSRNTISSDNHRSTNTNSQQQQNNNTFNNQSPQIVTAQRPKFGNQSSNQGYSSNVSVVFSGQSSLNSSTDSLKINDYGGDEKRYDHDDDERRESGTKNRISTVELSANDILGGFNFNRNNGDQTREEELERERHREDEREYRQDRERENTRIKRDAGSDESVKAPQIGRGVVIDRDREERDDRGRSDERSRRDDESRDERSNRRGYDPSMDEQSTNDYASSSSFVIPPFVVKEPHHPVIDEYDIESQRGFGIHSQREDDDSQFHIPQQSSLKPSILQQYQNTNNTPLTQNMPSAPLNPYNTSHSTHSPSASGIVIPSNNNVVLPSAIPILPQRNSVNNNKQHIQFGDIQTSSFPFSSSSSRFQKGTANNELVRTDTDEEEVLDMSFNRRNRRHFNTRSQNDMDNENEIPLDLSSTPYESNDDAPISPKKKLILISVFIFCAVVGLATLYYFFIYKKRRKMAEDDNNSKTENARNHSLPAPQALHFGGNNNNDAPMTKSATDDYTISNDDIVSSILKGDIMHGDDVQSSISRSGQQQTSTQKTSSGDKPNNSSPTTSIKLDKVKSILKLDNVLSCDAF